MNELVGISNAASDRRWRLLVGVSALALIGTASGPQAAASGEDSDHPTVWIELGGQLERVEGGQEAFLPPFTTIQSTPSPYEPVSPAAAQRPPRYSVGGEAKLTFEPDETDWTFTAAVRYGRAKGGKRLHQQTAVVKEFANPKYVILPSVYPTPIATTKGQELFESNGVERSSHTILDFEAGKDVGLGLFGRNGSSRVNMGVRFAEFTSSSHVTMHARPTFTFESMPFFYSLLSLPCPRHDDYYAKAEETRSFRGIGPAVSWDASTVVMGNSDSGHVSVDWGLNAAILFGRQKAKGSEYASAGHYEGRFPQTGNGPATFTPLYHRSADHRRVHSVIVPNIGGLAGLSFRFPNAKLSFGYRADLFFGAMDGGIENRNTRNVFMHGPFATISVGFP
jgi:hypothetical protein